MRVDFFKLYGVEGSRAVREAGGPEELVAARDEFGYSLLHDAAGTANLEMVEFLLTHGADPNARGYKKMTPLHSYAQFGGSDVKIGRALVLAGANVNARDTQGHSPLMVAAMWGNIVAVTCLLALGADSTLKSRSGKAARELATKTLEQLPKTRKFREQREQLLLVLDVLWDEDANE